MFPKQILTETGSTATTLDRIPLASGAEAVHPVRRFTARQRQAESGRRMTRHDLLASPGIPPDQADDAVRYFRWWCRLLAVLILTLGVVW
jgi:hypothetical protein